MGPWDSCSPHLAALGRGTAQVYSSCRSLQEGPSGAFQDICSMTVPGHCVFVSGIYLQASPDTGSSQHTLGTSMALPSCRDEEPTEPNPTLHPVTLYSAWIRWTHSHPSSHNPKLPLHPPLLHPMLRCSEAPRANLSCTSQGRQSTDAEPLRTALQEGHSLQSCSSPIAHSVHIVSPQATNTHDNS